MNTNFDHRKISITAKLVAYFRQFSDIPFSKEVAHYIHAEDAFKKLTEGNSSSGDMNERAPHFEARYKSIVNLIAKSGIHQVLELASGFSLRGLAMTSDPNLTYIESDLPELTAEKAGLIGELRSKLHLKDQGNHHLAAANALKIDELRVACKPLRRDQRLIVVNEGLLHYLSMDETHAIAQNVHDVLKEFGGGVWITPDFALKSDMADTSGRQQFGKLVKSVTGRDLSHTLFESDKELESFFKKHGFKSSVHSQFDESPRLVTVEQLKIPPEVVDRLRARFRIWSLRA